MLSSMFLHDPLHIVMCTGQQRDYVFRQLDENGDERISIQVNVDVKKASLGCLDDSDAWFTFP